MLMSEGCEGGDDVGFIHAPIIQILLKYTRVWGPAPQLMPIVYAVLMM